MSWTTSARGRSSAPRCAALRTGCAPGDRVRSPRHGGQGTERAVPPLRTSWVLGPLVAAAAVALTWVVPDFRLRLLALAGTLAIAMLGLNVLTGYNGQISLGHGAFIGIGAYTEAILVRELDMPYLLALVVAAALCFALGCLIGLPALRLPGSSLALVTLAFALALPQAVKKYDGLTGGTYGIYTPLDQQFNSPWTGL